MAGISGAVMQIEKLKGSSNYLAWSERVRAVLVREDLIDCLDSTPSDDDERQRDRKARAAIVLAVDDTHLTYLASEPTAQGCWRRLRGLYQKVSPACKVLLARQIFSMRLHDVRNKDQHVAKMLSLFNDLSARGSNFNEQHRALILLSSLGEEFNSFIDSVQNIPEDELCFDIVAQRLQAWHDFRANSRKVSTSANDSSAGFKENDCAIVCFKCKRKGHYARSCKFKSSASSKPGEKQTSTSCESDKPERKKQQNQRQKKAGGEPVMYVGSHCKSHGTEPVRFAIDSGSSRNYVNSECLLQCKEPVQGQVASMANGAQNEVLAQGRLHIASLNASFDDALFVPQLKHNILSVSQLCHLGFKVEFEHGKCLIRNNQTNTCVEAIVRDGIYFLESATENEVFSTCLQGSPLHKADCSHMLHRKFGHTSFAVLRKTLQVVNCKVSNCKTFLDCSVCNKVKLKAFPIPKTSQRESSEILQLVHMDLAGPFDASLGGARFAFLIVDDYSRFGFVYVLKGKHEVFQKFSEWLKLMQTQHRHNPVMKIQTDRGGEFVNDKMLCLLKQNGIIHRKTNPYCSAENGIAERRLGTLQIAMKAMLEDSKMSSGFWAEALATANFVQNRLWHSSIQQTPYYLFYGKKPNVKFFKVFGSYANVLVPKEQRGKRQQNWQRMRFVGYEPNTKGYRFWNNGRDGKKVVISRSVKFEDHTNWAEIHANTEVFFTPSLPRVKKEKEVTHTQTGEQVKTQEEAGSQTVIKQEGDTVTATTPQAHTQSQASTQLQLQPPPSTSFQHDDSSEEEEQTAVVGPRRSTRSNKGVPPQRLILSQVTSDGWKEPQTYAEVLRRPKEERECWLAAMKKEFQSLHTLHVLEQASAPQDTKLVGCKWVFKRKTQSDGEHIFRARLVAQGFSQVYQENYDEVYAPTVKPETVRLALGIGCKRGYVMRHFDIETAYLNANLEEEVYMKAIPGFEKDTSTGVYRLKKALYGLKQSARNWNACLDQKLNNLGFVRSSVDACLYKRGKEQNEIYVLVFVDDLLVLAANDKLVDNVFKGLSTSLKVKDLGSVKKYLGVEVNKTELGLELSQRDKIQELLERTRMSHCKPVGSPMVTDFLKLEKGDDFQNQSLYRSVIGSLLYLANWTRPDIAYAVNVLSRRVQCPNYTDWQGVKRVLRYLSGTIDKRLEICPNEKGLQCFVDSSFADNEENRSCTGYLIGFSGILVSWRSRKQKNVSLSTAEAEFSALSECCTEIEWVNKLVNEFENYNQTVPVYCDSQTCIEMTKSENLKHRTKYVGVRYENVRKLVKDGMVKLVYVQSEKNVADLLTKALPESRVQTLSEMLNLW